MPMKRGKIRLWGTGLYTLCAPDLLSGHPVTIPFVEEESGERRSPILPHWTQALIRESIRAFNISRERGRSACPDVQITWHCRHSLRPSS